MRPCLRSLPIIAGLLCLGAAPAQVDPLGQRIERIRDRFVAAVRACGVEPRFTPGVRIAVEPGVISYRSTSRTLVIGRWNALPDPIKAFLDQWARHDMPGKTGEQLFDELFNRFLVGHELGHWAADQSGRLATLDHYDAEIEADRFAIAFAEREPGLVGTPEDLVGRFAFLATLPDPVPAGEDERGYLDRNYDAISGSDPLAYNWYQGRFMQEAWKRRGSTDFCGLVKLSAAKGVGGGPSATAEPASEGASSAGNRDVSSEAP